MTMSMCECFSLHFPFFYLIQNLPKIDIKLCYNFTINLPPIQLEKLFRSITPPFWNCFISILDDFRILHQIYDSFQLSALFESLILSDDSILFDCFPERLAVLLLRCAFANMCTRLMTE